MRIVSYSSEGGSRAGVLTDGRVFDAGASVRELIAGDGLDRVEAVGEGHAPDEVELLPPVPDPDAMRPLRRLSRTGRNG